MGRVSRSDHPSDADLLEELLARETHPHLAHCVRCAERAETIAREIDPTREEPEELLDDLFYRRQAARIRARIAEGERRRSSPRPAVPRSAVPKLAWAGAAAAAVVALAVGLKGPRPVGQGGGPAFTLTGDARGSASTQDLADDRLLRKIDHVLDQDPYDFDAFAARRRVSTSRAHRSS